MRYPVALSLAAVVALGSVEPLAARVAPPPRATHVSRLDRLVEANVVATHAYQVILAKKSGKGDAACFGPGRLSDAELGALVDHQERLLKTDASDVRAWARGARSRFDPSADLDPILSAGLAVPETAPVNVVTRYLRRHTKADAVKVRSVASLYQTVLEIERDGDLLQEQFAFYIALGLPVYVGQLGFAGGDDAMLAAGRELAGPTCAAPFDTDAAAWQIAGRKIWNWGEKNLHVRDERTVATELLREPGVAALVPRIRAMPAERIAVVGHSYTMALHWASPSSFVAIAAEVLRRVNPRVEVKQFASGGLTASRAEQRFYADVLAWKPDAVLLVVIARTDADYDALRRMVAGFVAAGIRVQAFDDIGLPAVDDPGDPVRAAAVVREAGGDVVDVKRALEASPGRARFLSLDRIHMTEPYHRLMAVTWLEYLSRAASR